MVYRFLLFTSICLPVSLCSQDTDDFLIQLIEWTTENADEEIEWDVTDLADALTNWRKNPIDINSEIALELSEWSILTPLQYSQLRNHIEKYGPLLSILELQSIESFDLTLIRLLQNLCTIQSGSNSSNIPLMKEIVHGRNEFNFRISKQWPKSKGYQSDVPVYEGSNERILFRFRHTSTNALSFGFTLEKDAGEKLIKDFTSDFTSGFIFYKPPSGRLSFILGDYVFNTGQGLILNNGFGGNKHAPISSLLKTAKTTMPFRSSDENRYMRGAILEYKLSDRFSCVGLFSSHLRDANISIDGASITSLQTSGLHRTIAENDDKNAVKFNRYGGTLKYHHQSNSVTLNILNTTLSLPLYPTPSLYNQFNFQGHSLWQVSLSYRWQLLSFYVFGESAFNPGGGMAHLSGIILSPDKAISATIVGRHYSKRYHSIDANSFGENSQPNNETGIYGSIQIKLSPVLLLENSFDTWSHPWLRYQIYRPSKGNEWLSRITYTVRRKLQSVIQFRYRSTEASIDSESSYIYQVMPTQRWQARLQFSLQVGNGWEIRTRMEYLEVMRPVREQGFLLAQDIHYSPPGTPWVIRLRAALFNTDSYTTRIYAYEQDLLYQYSVPSLSDSGSRYYMLVRYKGIRNLTLEIKAAETRYVSRPFIGSGWDEKPGPVTGEIKFQLIYLWDVVGKPQRLKSPRRANISSEQH